MKRNIYALNSTSELSVSDWIDTFDGNEFQDWSNIELMAAGWWDWFDYGYSRRTKFTKTSLGILKAIVNSDKINPDTMYVWFKQSLRGDGVLTEHLKISDKATGNVLYSIGNTVGEGWELWDFTGRVYTTTEWDREVFEKSRRNKVIDFFMK